MPARLSQPYAESLSLLALLQFLEPPRHLWVESQDPLDCDIEIPRIAMVETISTVAGPPAAVTEAA